MPSKISHHIKSIEIKRLFGRYNYLLPKGGQDFSDLNIIYAENGLGKTTLLTIVFHLLSPADNRGHKTAISEIPFQYICVTLANGTEITAEKDAQLLTGPVVFEIREPDRHTAWKFIPNSRSAFNAMNLPRDIDIGMVPSEMQDDVKAAIAQREYFAELGKLKVHAYMLTSDRILLGDSTDSDGDSSPIPSGVVTPRKIAKLFAEQRSAAVASAITTTSSWLQSKFIERGYGAADSVGNVYEKVIKRVATTPYRTSTGVKSAQQTKIRDALIPRIQDINKRAGELGSIGLPKRMVSPELVNIVQNAKGNKLLMIENVLSPHLTELEARIENIEPFFDLVQSFVLHLNRFFRDKTISYSLREGVRIVSSEEGLDTQIFPHQLSSGEQQLLLMFCHVLVTRDNPSIFIIDEPEISLNIVWQRMLVASLQKVSDGHTQFVFASHSMEILAKHRNRVVTLED